MTPIHSYAVAPAPTALRASSSGTQRSQARLDPRLRWE